MSVQSDRAIERLMQLGRLGKNCAPVSFSLGEQSLNFLSPEKRSFIFLIVLLHTLFFWLQGAVIWADASSYINISDALLTSQRGVGIITGEPLWWHNYVPLGLPLLWNALALLPVKLIWPCLAVGQHAIAASALVYCTRSFYSTWPSRWFAVAAVALCLIPFYQSMHNALLTESLSSSFLLISLGTLVGAINSRSMSARASVLICICIFFATQLRSTVAIFCLGIACATLIRQGRLLSGNLAAFSLAFIFGILLFPSIRALDGGEFIFPRLGPSKLWAGLYANPNPSPELTERFRSYQLPPSISAERLLKEGASFGDVTTVMRSWVDAGASNTEAIGKIEDMGRALIADGYRPRLNSIGYGLSSSGFNFYLLALPADYEIFRGFNGRKLFAHERNHYLYLSWVRPNVGAFDSQIAEFFEKDGKSELHRLFAASMKPYFRSQPTYLHSIMGLVAYIPLDLFFLLSLAASAVLLRKDVLLGSIFLGIPLINIYITGSSLFADVRYSYALLGTFLFSIATCVALLPLPPTPVLLQISAIVKRNFSFARKGVELRK